MDALMQDAAESKVHPIEQYPVRRLRGLSAAPGANDVFMLFTDGACRGNPGWLCSFMR